MTPSLSAVEVLRPGLRVGTPSSLFKMRVVDKTIRGTVSSRPMAWAAPTELHRRHRHASKLRNSCCPVSRFSTSRGRHAKLVIADEDLRLLHDVVSSIPPRALSLRAIDRHRTKKNMLAVVAKDASVPSYWRLFKNARVALFYLEQLVASGHEVDESRRAKIQDEILNMPPSTFSELLRTLDPLGPAGSELDPATGWNIGGWAAQSTLLGESVDIWGVRNIYRRIRKCVFAAAELRLQNGRKLLANDYRVLMHSAASCSDYAAIRHLWSSVRAAHYEYVQDGSMFTDAFMARFLIEPLYTQFDATRLRFRPINLILNQGKVPGRDSPNRVSPTVIDQWRRLGRHIVANQIHRFGQDAVEGEHAERFAQPLSQRLSGRKPLVRNLQYAMGFGYVMDEKLACALLIAFGRAASLKKMRKLILGPCYDIHVFVQEDGTINIRGGKEFRPDSPLRPTARLLDAVMQAWCCNGNVLVAAKLVQYISEKYNVPIPQKVWFDLLNWTYIRLSKPSSTEYDKLGYAGLKCPNDAVLLLWAEMTSGKYNVKPGFSQYSILIKTLLERRRYRPALSLMSRMYEQHYLTAVREVEEAFYELVLARRLHADAAQASRRWQRAQARKQYIWATMSSWTKMAFKRIPRAKGVLDGNHVILIPKMVGVLLPFCTQYIRYRMPTGLVEIKNAEGFERMVMHEETALQPALMSATIAHPDRFPWGYRPPGKDMREISYGDGPVRPTAAPRADYRRRLMRFKIQRANASDRFRIENILAEAFRTGNWSETLVPHHFT